MRRNLEGGGSSGPVWIVESWSPCGEYRDEEERIMAAVGREGSSLTGRTDVHTMYTARRDAPYRSTCNVR
jgi:hypothetical protein